MGVYNGERHVQQAIFSILAQDYENYELIIINDGSTDNSLAKIKQIQDPRIIIIDQENQGLTKSLNNGLKIAKGDLIARQDADDISLINRFSTQIKAFEVDSELGLLGCSMYISNSRGTFNEIFHYPCSYLDIKQAIFSYNPFIHGAMMIRKELLVEVGGYNEDFRYVQDYELWSRLVFKIKCANLPQPLYARLREGDCSETSVDKSSYVEAIQKSLNAVQTSKKDVTPKAIKAQSIYPYIGWPFNHCKPLSQTYKKMASVAEKYTCSFKQYKKNSIKYFPWSI
jgi:glycosyltransferase involved in cell wall biosynthesis